MTLRDLWERAKGSIAIAFMAVVSYLGGWVLIGWTLFHLGPWGMAGACTLFVVHIALFFFNTEWSLRLFACSFLGALSRQVWTLFYPIGVVLLCIAVELLFERKLKSTTVTLGLPRNAGLEALVLLLARLGIPKPDAKTVVWDGTSFSHISSEPDEASAYLLRVLDNAQFPKQAEHRDQSEDSKSGPVDCTVFAPDRVERKQTALLQVFLHSPEAQEEAESMAREFDPETKERGYRSLLMDASIGTSFTFDVEIEDFVFRERTDTLIWNGRPEAATFPFNVPKGAKFGQHIGVVRISKDGTPIGRISFQIEVAQNENGADTRPVGNEARHYRACFCSYSSLDRAEMLKRAQGLRATGLKTFIDVMDLRPGDEWNPKIFSAIDESDLFVVIWSKSARGSKWVEKESRYALRRYKKHGIPDFRPIPVDGPPIAPVPRGLKAYHFNDELLGQIRAAELEMRARKKAQSGDQKPEA